MELLFEYQNTIDIGENPNMVHLPDGNVWAFKVDKTRLKAFEIVNPIGDVDWENLTTGDFVIATKGTNISLVRLKNIPRVGMFGVWHQDPIMDGDDVLTPERHRLAIWGSISDVSKYLDDCTIQLNDDTPVASVQIKLKNPKQELSGEDNSIVVPGMKIEMFLTLGDSAEYPMGVQYIDRVNMGALQDVINIEGRNITGKMLRDQTLDENNVLTKKVYRHNVVELLENAGISSHNVQPPPDVPEPWEYGVVYPPNMSMLDALNNLIQASLNWKVIETLDGEIIAGSTATFEDIQVNSRYTFNRDTDVFSRDIIRDDDEAYARVCCYYETETIDEITEEVITGTEYIYSVVDNNADWEIQPNKTLYVQLSKNTDNTDAQNIADDLADRLRSAGKIETFIGPIRPHLLPGDEATIVSDNGSNLLGIITTVRHQMGKNGFITEFTVDSGGRMGKPKIRDYISSLSNAQSMQKGTVL
jgi:hypothetical protein